MVLIKNLTQSQINTADNFRGEVITNADANRLMFNTGTQFTYLVYSDLNNVITGLSGISATNITGTLQTPEQPNITSLGTLEGLTVNNNLVVAEHNGVDTGLTLGGALVTSSAAQLNYVNTTPGTAEAGKALITDSNNSIVGLTNLETDNLTVNGTLVTSSAIELNYVDVDTLGQAYPNKALVLDANKDIVGINTLEADYIKVNGTLVTSSAIELNYVDVNTLGTAEGSKALVVDANRDIGNIRNLTAENLTGTLQTAAQPNVTSLGNLTGLTVTGHTNLNSLSVNGVPLDAFNLGGLKMRVYSNTDFTGRVIKADIVEELNFTDYEPVVGVSENYSMEIWGYIKPTYTEDYIFTISSNDKFRLWVNNELVKVAWTEGDHENLQTGLIPLVANSWYPIYIQHAQILGDERFVINWSSTTQTSEMIPSAAMAYDDKVMNITSKKSYTQDSINLYDGVNSNVSTISTNPSGDLIISAFSDNVNIENHNGSTTGLKLNGTLITSTAEELNYVDTTPGVSQSLKAVVLDLNKDTTGIRNVSTVGTIGVNTSTPSKQLEINSATGDVLRLTRDNNTGTATEYADMTISADGKLTINSSGDETIIHSSDNFNIAGHDGSTLGLKLNNVLVTSSAVELNYVDTTPGTAEASKALVVNADRNISNINILSTSTLTSISDIESTSTSTGAITTAGGVGIAKNLNVGGVAEISNTTNATNADSGALVVSGGAGIKKALYVGDEEENGYFNLNGTADILGGINVEGVVNMNNATQSTSTSTGALVVDGGVGIAKSVNVGETLTVAGNATLSSNVVVDGPSLRIPVGDTSERPVGVLGQIRYNDETSQFEGFGAGNSWGSLGGVTDVDQDTRISAETAAGDDNDELRFYNAGLESMRLTSAGLMGLGTTTPSKKLEINSATGDALRMTYNDADGSADNYVDMTISSDGKLTINSSGDETIIHSSDNFNIAGHNGSTLGLKLSGVLVTATATELNYVDTTQGTAEASKALVVNADRNISNVNDLSLTGDIVAVGTTTTSGVVLSSADSNDYSFISMDTNYISMKTSSGFQWNTGADDGVPGTKIMELDTELSITVPQSLENTTDSTSTTTGALKVAGGVGIAKSVNIGQNLNVDGNVDVDGPSLRIPVGDISERPVGALGQVRYNSETSQFEGFGGGNTWRSLEGVMDIDQDTRISAETAAGDDNDELRFYNAGLESMRLTSTGLMGLGTTNPNKKLEINSATGDALRLTHNDTDGSAVNYVDLNIDESGNLILDSSGNETTIHSSDSLNVAGHDGSTMGLKLAGVLVTSTAVELNYVNTTPGTAEASKALVMDVNRNISNIVGLSTSTLTSISTEESISVATGAIITAGGAGIAKNLNVGGLQKITNLTNATSAGTGALVVNGGAGIKKALYVGEEGSSVTTTTYEGGSPLGANWTNRTPSNANITDTLWFGIDWSSTLNMYVAVGSTLSGHKIMNSTDGITWNTVANVGDSDDELFDVKWVSGMNKFVAIGRHTVVGESSLLVATSSNGTAWTVNHLAVVMDAGTNNIYENLNTRLTLEYSSSLNRLVAVGTNIILHSTDGDNWTEIRETSKPYANITWSGSKFIAIGLGGLYSTSTNGITWSHQVISSEENLEEIAYSPSLSKYLIKGIYKLYSSTDGESWTMVDSDNYINGIEDYNWKSLRWVSSINQFVAVGYNTGKSLITSSDGITWTTFNGIPNVEYEEFAFSPSLNRLVTIASYHDTIKIASSDISLGTEVSTTTTTPADGYFNLKGDADIVGDLTVEGTFNMNSTTQSTSTTTGALVVDGGVGIAKNVNIGEMLTVGGNTTLSANVAVDGPSLRIPVGNTTARPVGVLGQIRYNNETSQFEGFGAGNSWGSLGGVTDVDQDTRISAETAAGDDNDELRFYNAGLESMRLTSTGLMGLGTSTPSKKLEINSSTGDVLRLTYDDANGSAVNYADMSISSDGKLTINSSGDETIIHSSDNFNIAGHNGSTLGLKLADVLVTATATELNYVDTTPGTAEASKALVVNADRNISNVNVLTADTINVSTFGAEDLTAENINTTGNVGINTTSLLFGLQVNEAAGNVLRLTHNDSTTNAPTSKADFTMDDSNNLSISVANSVNIAVHDGVDKGLKLNGTLITSTATELNYVDTTPGAAQASKALVLDADRNITNINSISMNNLNLTYHDNVDDTMGTPLTITRTSSEAPANGLGVSMAFKIENSTNTNVEFGNLGVVATDITNASEGGNFVVNLMNNGVMTESLRLSTTTLFTQELHELSDARLKENIIDVSIQETHERVMSLQLVDYNYINQHKTHRGILAQQIENVIPSAVETSEKNGLLDCKTVSTREITNHLIGSVQYLSSKLDETLAKLENVINEFEAYKQAHP